MRHRLPILTFPGRITLPNIVTVTKRPRNAEFESVGPPVLADVSHGDIVNHPTESEAMLLLSTDYTSGRVKAQRRAYDDTSAPHKLAGELGSALSRLLFQISSFTESIIQMQCPKAELPSSSLIKICAATAEFKAVYDRLSVAHHRCFSRIQQESRDKVRLQMIAEITAMGAQ